MQIIKKQANEILISSPIINFYDEKTIFVTGGTGFLGTVLIEKLLYTCDNLKNIYMLMKPKHGKNIQSRLTELTSSPVFQRIRERNPDVLKKIVLMEGNIHDKYLGLNEENIEILKEQVNIVFHVAADVSFKCTLADAININTRSTEELVKLIKEMRNLQAYVQVSSAYCNCQNNIIDEKVYQTLIPLKSVYYLIDELEENVLVRNVMGKRPNTYTYSKALAEEILYNQIGDFPASIVRPSIILSSLRDPIPGWVDGWTGCNGIVTFIGKGIIRCWHGDPNSVSDIIPVDIVANLLIAAAWDTNERRLAGKKGLKVFNCCSGLQNPITFGKFMMTSMLFTRKHTFNGAVSTPSLIITKNSIFHYILLFFMQILPAFVADIVSLVLRRERRMLKMQKKTDKLAEMMEFFTLSEFTFIDYNVRELFQRLSEDDKNIFQFNVRSIDWNSYIENYVIGLKKYLLKETN